MYLVNEQNIVGFQVRQNGRQITRALKHRARGLSKTNTHFVGNNVSQRCLAQPGRAEYQYVIQRLFTSTCRLNEDTHLLVDAGLAVIILKRFRTDCPVKRLVFANGFSTAQAIVLNISHYRAA